MKTDKNCECAKVPRLDDIFVTQQIKKPTAELLRNVKTYINVYFASHEKHVACRFGPVIAIYGENHMKHNILSFLMFPHVS
jgi:hypothetical protein